MTARRLATVLVVLAATAVSYAPAQAQTTTCPSTPSYAPSSGTATVADSTLIPGQTVAVSGGGFAAGSTVTLSLNPGGTALGSDTVDADCTFSTTVTIPTSVLGTSFTIQASGTDPSGNARVLSAAVTVGAADAAAGGLPTTGSNSTQPLTVAGIGLVLIGAAAVVVVRRRRSQSALD